MHVLLKCSPQNSHTQSAIWSVRTVPKTHLCAFGVSAAMTVVANLSHRESERERLNGGSMLVRFAEDTCCVCDCNIWGYNFPFDVNQSSVDAPMSAYNIVNSFNSAIFRMRKFPDKCSLRFFLFFLCFLFGGVSTTRTHTQRHSECFGWQRNFSIGNKNYFNH